MRFWYDEAVGKSLESRLCKGCHKTICEIRSTFGRREKLKSKGSINKSSSGSDTI